MRFQRTKGRGSDANVLRALVILRKEEQTMDTVRNRKKARHSRRKPAR